MNKIRIILLLGSCIISGIKAFPQSDVNETNTELKALIDDIASPVIALDQAGNAIAVWYDTGPIRYSIYAARYTYNGGWQSKVMLSSNVNMAAPQIACDDRGNAFVVWCEDGGTNLADVYVARYVVGIGWQPKINVSTTTMHATNPSIVVDATGNATIVWREMAHSGHVLYAIRYLAAGGWQSKVKIS